MDDLSPHSRYHMDNSGRGPLRVPGFGGIPLQYELPHKDRFAHAMVEWRQNTPITEHELQMVQAMNVITDVHNWHVLVFDKVITAIWREITRTTYPLITDKAWNWCMQELQDKATTFSRTGFVRVLDTGSAVCKGDSLFSTELISGIASSLQPLFAKTCPAHTSAEVSVVDPQMYPLVYGRTPVLQDGGTTRLDSLTGATHPRRVSVKTNRSEEHEDERDAALNRVKAGRLLEKFHPLGSDDPLRHVFAGEKFVDYLFSSDFQCLPCDVQLVDNKIRIVSYINNLHPRHTSMYASIEKLISSAIEPWNTCLVKAQYLPESIRTSPWRSGRPQCGRIQARIPFFGRQWVNELPFIALSFNPDYPEESRTRLHDGERCSDQTRTEAAIEKELSERKRYDEKYRDPFQEVTDKPAVPAAAAWKWAEEYLSLPDSMNSPTTTYSSLPEDWQSNVWQLISKKALARMPLFHTSRSGFTPEPGMAMSYKDWKCGHFHDPSMSPIFTKPLEWYPRHDSNIWPPGVIGLPRNKPHRVSSDEPKRTEAQRLAGPYYQGPTLQNYSVHLQDYFKQSGLQVIVKISSIELSPENPCYNRKEWQLQGFLNEHIVATAILAVDASNITPCRVEFRQETTEPLGDDPFWYQMYPDDPFNPSMISNPVGPLVCAQRIGSVDMRTGRLIAFPNIMEHRLSSFQLMDSTCSGRIRFVTLNLVDPNYRICSTSNVPAQQHELWAEEMEDVLHQMGLSAELCTLITSFCQDSPVSYEQALEDKESLQHERDLLETARFCMMS